MCNLMHKAQSYADWKFVTPNGIETWHCELETSGLPKDHGVWDILSLDKKRIYQRSQRVLKKGLVFLFSPSWSLDESEWLMISSGDFTTTLKYHRILIWVSHVIG